MSESMAWIRIVPFALMALLYAVLFSWCYYKHGPLASELIFAAGFFCFGICVWRAFVEWRLPE